MLRCASKFPYMINWEFFYFYMDPHLRRQKRFIKYKTIKHIVVFILFVFVYNVIFFPSHASASENRINSQAVLIIKSPESEAISFTYLSEKKENKTPDNRPKVAKDFKLVEIVPFPEAPTPPAPKIASNKSYLNNSGNVGISSEGVFVTITAYNSEPAQTSGNPCITANGFNVCQHGIEDTVAANFLPFGTKIMIPDYFGERVFIVRDRTARKYGNRVDVWMLSKKDAINFGKRTLRVVILEQ